MIDSMQKFVVVGALILALVLGATIYKVGFMQSTVTGIEVDWRLLGEMDYITGKAPKELQDLDGHEVKIPGFMVPLEDSQRAVTEFLLVPSPQACIHVPAPPPNQMIYVKMSASSRSEVAYGPIWVYGKLKMVTQKSMYGDSSFQIEGQSIEPYK